MNEVTSKTNFSDFITSKTLIASKMKEKDQEAYYLKAELKNKINELNQLKMNFVQKTEFLEKQIQEGKLREKNLRSLNENLTKALEEISSEKKNPTSSEVKLKNLFFYPKKIIKFKKI
jgi:hypothetical protein